MQNLEDVSKGSSKTIGEVQGTCSTLKISMQAVLDKLEILTGHILGKVNCVATLGISA